MALDRLSHGSDTRTCPAPVRSIRFVPRISFRYVNQAYTNAVIVLVVGWGVQLVNQYLRMSSRDRSNGLGVQTRGCQGIAHRCGNAGVLLCHTVAGSRIYVPPEPDGWTGFRYFLPGDPSVAYFTRTSLRGGRLSPPRRHPKDATFIRAPSPKSGAVNAYVSHTLWSVLPHGQLLPATRLHP